MAKKTEKRKSKKSFGLIFCVILIAIGAVCGYFVSQKVTENDKFEIVGEKVIEVEVGGTYTDEGAVVISFGKNLSSKIKTENNIDFSTAGQYYIKYTVDNFRFKGVARYRIIKVVEVQNEEVV